jgi:hypothetical protein
MLFDGLWRNPGPPFPHCASLHAGYELNGGQRPPFALVMASMRQLAIGLLAFILCAQIAHGADKHCQLLERNADHTEWSEGDEFRGARIVSRDSRWELGEVDWNIVSTASATCRTCSDHQISGGPLWLWVSDRLQGDIYKWISPESVARVIQLRSNSRDAELHAVSGAVQVSVGGYPGLARILSVNDRGRSSQVIAVAVAVAKECLSLAGILSEKDGAPTAIDRLDSFASSIAVELYKPVPGKFTAPWRGSAPDFHIGDLKQLLLGEQP